VRGLRSGSYTVAFSLRAEHNSTWQTVRVGVHLRARVGAHLRV
jgi:hypothetical protein